MEDRVLISKLAAHEKWARCPDRAAATAAARKAFNDHWLAEVLAEFPDLDEAAAVKMAEAAKKAYYTRLALRSVKVRRARKAARDGGA